MSFVGRFAAALLGGASPRTAFTAARSQSLNGSPRTPSYDAAPHSSRRTVNWQPSNEAMNALVFGSSESLRRRSRDVGRRTPWARKAHRVYTANAVGTGIRPQSLHPDPDIRKMLQEAFEDWNHVAALDGLMPFYGLQALAVKNKREAGEIFARFLVMSDAPSDEVPLRLQMIEADQIDWTRNEPLPNGGKIVQGIEHDSLGRRVAFWVQRDHPGEIIQSARSSEVVRVPAEDMIHLFEPDRPNQAHGLPDMASSLLRLFDFDEYEDAQLVKQRDTSKFSGFIKDSGLEDTDEIIEGKETTDPHSGQPLVLTQLEAGTFQKLLNGEDIVFPPAAELGEGYADFLTWNLRGVAASSDVTYAQLTGDHSKENFASLRAGLLDIRRGIEQFQGHSVNHQVNRPTWNRWLNVGVLSGALDISPRQFNRERKLFQRVNWVPQGWEWVDPLKDVEAEIRAIKAGLQSRSASVSKRGRDIDDVDKEISDDQKRADKLDLTFDSDGRDAQTSSGGGVSGAGRSDLDDDDDERARA